MSDSGRNDILDAVGALGCAMILLFVAAALVVIFAAPVVLVGTLIFTISLGLLPTSAQKRIGCATPKERMEKGLAISAGVVALFLVAHLIYFLSGGDQSPFSYRYEHSVVGIYVQSVMPYYIITGKGILAVLVWIKDGVVWLCESLYRLANGKGN